MGYSVRKIDLLNEAKEVARLWQENLDTYKDNTIYQLKDKVRWYYTDSIFGSGMIFFLFEDNINYGVGSGAVCKRRFKIGNEIIEAGLIGNFLIEKKHRTLGPALLLQKNILKNGKKEYGMLYGFVPKQVQPVLNRIGYKIIGYKKRYSLVLKSQKKILDKIKSKFLACSISFVLDIILYITAKELRVFKMNKYIGKHINDIDSRFDKIWEHISKLYEITEIRTSTSLNWRYKECPYRNYRFFCLTDKEEKNIFGYIIYDFITEDILRIMDIFVDYNDNKFDILISKFIKMHRKNDVQAITIEIMCAKRIAKKFRSYRFIERKEKNPIMIKLFNFNDANGFITNKNNWYITSGSDNG